MPKKKKPAPKKPVAKRRAAPRSKPTAKTRPVKKTKPTKPAARAAAPAVAPDRVGAFREAILRHLKSTFARDPVTATRNDWWFATCMAARDQILERYIATQAEHSGKNVRRVYYLSLEYLMGRVLGNNLVNLTFRCAFLNLFDFFNRFRNINCGILGGDLAPFHEALAAAEQAARLAE
jgi:hypothetical protein